MTLLLVDDQINVINGLMNGINYRKLEIDTVLPSTSVQEAKTLICENQISKCREKTDCSFCTG